MRRLILTALAAALAGCGTAPPAPYPGAGGITCIHVSTLATSTTTVYVAADRPGTVVVHPDCTVAATSK